MRATSQGLTALVLVSQATLAAESNQPQHWRRAFGGGGVGCRRACAYDGLSAYHSKEGH